MRGVVGFVVLLSTTVPSRAFLPLSASRCQNCASRLERSRVQLSSWKTIKHSRTPRMSAPGAEGMDAIISDLRSAQDSTVLAVKVSKSVKQVAQPAFFLRIAEMAEQTKSAQEKAQLEKLAAAVTAVLEKLVKFAENKMDDSASLVQIIVSSAAEKDGEFLVPLSEERLAALRQSVKIHLDSLDNNFLATVQAWMEKSGNEGLDGMVTILQKVLQLYAAEAILARGGSSAPDEGTEGTSKTPASSFLDQILTTDADQWDGILSEISPSDSGLTGGVTKDGLMGAIQVAIESVILQQENGSMAQRVQAEYMSELVKRIESASPDRPPGIA